MIRTIILDLDGPLLDGKVRHYSCYKQILEKMGVKPVGLDSYWKMKRERVDIKEFLAVSDQEIASIQFKKLWLELIEQPQFLALDRLQAGVVEKMQGWREDGKQLMLVTQRHNEEYLHFQLCSLGLNVLLDRIIVSSYDDGGKGKAERLRHVAKDVSPTQSLWVGDTEVDVEAARHFGCPIWAVSCGLRSISFLASLSPNYLVPDLTYVNC